MDSPDSRSEAARSLNAQRWGNQVVQRAVGTVVSRADELGEAELEQLERVVTERRAAADE